MVDALKDFTGFLKGDSGVAQSSKYIAQIAALFPDVNDQRSVVLRLIIHYMGDLHQPLHAVARVDHSYPTGDMGGNAEVVPDSSQSGVANLHAIWDSVIYEYPGYEVLPMNTADWKWYSEQASRIARDYPVPEHEILSGDFDAYAAESYALASTLVYPGKWRNSVNKDRQELDSNLLCG